MLRIEDDKDFVEKRNYAVKIELLKKSKIVIETMASSSNMKKENFNKQASEERQSQFDEIFKEELAKIRTK